jgi:hypothetical protein
MDPRRYSTSLFSRCQEASLRYRRHRQPRTDLSQIADDGLSDACELGRSVDDLPGRVHGRQSDNAFLQINRDQGSGGIEFS